MCTSNEPYTSNNVSGGKVFVQVENNFRFMDAFIFIAKYGSMNYQK